MVRSKVTSDKSYQIIGLLLIACLIVLVAVHQGTKQPQTIDKLHDPTELQQHTDHFTFKFQRYDAKAVSQAAPLIEQQYTTIRQAVRLSGPSPDEKISVIISRGSTQPALSAVEPTPSPRQLYPFLAQNKPALWQLQTVCTFGAVPEDTGMAPPSPEECPTVADLHFSALQFTLLSPTQLSIPADVNPTTVLTQAMIYLLAGHVLDERLQNMQMAPGWRPMLQAIRWWLGWDSPLPPPFWVDEASRVAEPTENRTVRYLADEQIVAARTVVAYAMQTYGRDKLPVLIDGFSQYDSWQALIPAVFDVSAEQFEQGWQTYVAAQSARSMR